MPDGMAFFDADDRLVLWNTRYAEVNPELSSNLKAGMTFAEILKVGLSEGLYADAVGAFIVEGQSARLSQAALETLAVVAYRQPVTRGQISQIRGVNVDSVMKTLSARGLITEVGEIGGAVLYGTTTEFLERLGLSSLDDLPPLAPYLPDLSDVDEVA